MAEATNLALYGSNECSPVNSVPREQFITQIGWEYSTNEEGRLGIERKDEMGRIWRWCKSESALSRGNTLYAISCESAGGGDGTTGTEDVGVVSGGNTVNDSSVFDCYTYYGPGWYVMNSNHETHEIDDGISTAKIRIIGTWTTALTTSTTFNVFCPSSVEVAATSSKKIVGVAQHDVTADYYFWMLVKGIGIVKVDASETTVGPGVKLIQSSAVAGLAEGISAVGTTTTTLGVAAAELQVGMIGMCIGLDVSTDACTAAMIDCT